MLCHFLTPPRNLKPLIVVAVLALVSSALANPWDANDLNPVTFQQAPAHEPIVLVENGEARGSIVVHGKTKGAHELQTFIRLATGSTLPIVRDTMVSPAIVLGDCSEAAALGLNGAKLPPEGFAIKTTANHVFIVGNPSSRTGNGQIWGVNEFAERYLGMRWYFPPATVDGPDIGQSFSVTSKVVVPPVSLSDAPFFRKRQIWPDWSIPSRGTGINMRPLHAFLRAGNSWPNELMVHTPRWHQLPEIVEKFPEAFQMHKNGKRDPKVICYSNPKTLALHLEGIQAHVDGQKQRLAPINGKAITVSPADVELACYCDQCKALWDDNGGQYGSASKVMTTFVKNLATEVKKRWPEQGFTILYLPYLNYTAAPDGITLPDNVEVQLCGMPGLAAYKEPAIRDAEQANIDRWIAMTGRPIQGWHYCVWPAHKTAAAYHYPHVIQDFYRRNRDKTVGTFINGDFNHWPRQHISLYCWLKLLWNPDFNVDAAIDEFCTRMFGNAAVAMRELLQHQMDGWQQSQWPGGRFSPKGIYAQSFPQARIDAIQQLFAKAEAAAKGDDLTLARLAYYKPALESFFEEAKMMSGRGFQPLQMQKTGENPIVDGKLDDPSWQRTLTNNFVVATGNTRGEPAKYPTTVQALWTATGITFGFRLSEPTPHLLETVHGGHDNGHLWWDDNVEIFLDVTGKSEGEFYQFIINANGDYWDSKGKDTTWECEGLQAKSFVGEDFWSLEVFVPYTAFPDGKIPGSGTHTKWTGNFTRHRVADRGLKRSKPQQPGSTREYQRMNTTGSTASDNLADFAQLKFIE